ncbi:transposase domain-containing protein [Streptomyces himalayensis]|uniref:Transposase domain-containing protein n=1 Tax=Streptomyces himalayensis subsp. himalayensis TaxID=2756131 RepID=A0A7W0IDI0_9ACTN|nr:transposase domain-containing protein [Streptomyces himalayensis subsp. himalayensis]
MTGRAERRRRLLPARAMVYFVLAPCLFSSSGQRRAAGIPDGPAAPDRETAAPAGTSHGGDPGRLLMLLRPCAMPSPTDDAP